MRPIHRAFCYLLLLLSLLLLLLLLLWSLLSLSLLLSLPLFRDAHQQQGQQIRHRAFRHEGSVRGPGVCCLLSALCYLLSAACCLVPGACFPGPVL